MEVIYKVEDNLKVRPVVSGQPRDYVWNMQSRHMMEALGLKKIPAEGFEPRLVGNVRVTAISLEIAKHQGQFHRILAECPDCGWWVPFGRLPQHRGKRVCQKAAAEK